MPPGKSIRLTKATPSALTIADRFTRTRPSVADRLAAGKALRTTVPLASLGEYVPSPKRKDPVAILEAQAKTRLPELIPALITFQKLS